MSQVLCQLPKFNDPNLIVGFDTSDDASVYKLNDSIALVQTVDVFPPVVDNAYEYGLIAAANSLSDVYAMGGEPKLCMNIFCYPEDLPLDVVQGILQGGYEKVIEAGAIITGGHTIKDPVPKYGLSVTGFVHPEKVWKNNSPKPGDILILTKALGSGILSTAAKAGIILQNDNAYKKMIKSMSTLNKYGADIIKNFSINSCTDVTGFGFLGHAYEMSKNSNSTLVFDSKNIPLLDMSLSFAKDGIVPAGSYANRSFLEKYLCIDNKIPLEITDILFDPQTSGGLLISIPEKDGLKLISELKNNIEIAEIVGYVMEYNNYNLIVN